MLANGTVTEANAKKNSDLFWALKGGAFNFGIVTRFDVNTFAAPFVWGGMALYDAAHVDDVIKAFASFATKTGGSSDPLAHADPTVTYNVTTGDRTVFSIYMRRGDDPAPASFKNFTSIPSTFQDLRVEKTIVGHVNDTNPINFQVGDRRQLFSSTGLKASPESVFLINQTFFDMIAKTPALKNTIDVSLSNTYQVFTPGMINTAKASGGDPIGLVDPNGNGVLGECFFSCIN